MTTRREAAVAGLSLAVVAALAVVAGSTEASSSVPGPAPASAAAPAETTAPAPATPAPPGSSAAPTAVPTATATFSTDPVGRQLRWFVGQMNTDPLDADLPNRFTAEFLTQVPPSRLVLLLATLRSQGPWQVESVATDQTSGVAGLLDNSGQRFVLRMQVTGDRIAGALLTTPPRGERATTWPAVTARAELAGGKAAVYAATVGRGDRLRPQFASGSRQPVPIASMVKLYVLAAVAERVAAGGLSWDTQLVLTAEDKSLPSGTLQDSPVGTRITVRQAATQMISSSDNTATDLLIRTVGTSAVQAAAARSGNTHPDGLRPLLTTRQLFWLALSDTPAARQARAEWAAGSPARRRDLLAALAIPRSGTPPVPAQPQVTWTAGVEWFASAEDLARAHLYLQRLATTASGRPVGEILTVNPGIDVPGWRQVAFKGGSDTGVVGLSFHALAGKQRQVLVLVVRGENAIHEDTVVAAAQDAAALLVAASQPEPAGAGPRVR